MTTIGAANAHAIAIDGSFDDCQIMVKAMFNDTAFSDGVQLSRITLHPAQLIPSSILMVVHLKRAVSSA